TYKLLSSQFYWPNMCNDTSWFVQSCIECHRALEKKPVHSYSESWTAPLIYHFNIDTIYMPTVE
ncbi:hypothetical protein GYMLUDRAFT_167410, partial [Collybiopsis luxurians FD-317 M1]